MAYRPVPVTTRICAHCKTDFEAKDRRRIYCSNSCNTLAWLARQPNQPHHDKADGGEIGDMNFSFQNVATVATGGIIAAGVNYLANDRPFYEALAQRINNIEQQLGYAAGRVAVEGKKMNMLTAALRRSSPEIDTQFRMLEVASANKLLP